MIEVVFAKTSAVVPLADGTTRFVQAGQHWPVDDPIVLAQPSLFSADPRYGLSASVEPKGLDDPPVESVTARPGEKRSAVRRG